MSLAVTAKFMNMLLSDGFRLPHTLCGGCAVLVSVGFVQAGIGYGDALFNTNNKRRFSLYVG
jgi:hypothetical protein